MYPVDSNKIDLFFSRISAIFSRQVTLSARVSVVLCKYRKPLPEPHKYSGKFEVNATFFSLDFRTGVIICYLKSISRFDTTEGRWIRY